MMCSNGIQDLFNFSLFSLVCCCVSLYQFLIRRGRGQWAKRVLKPDNNMCILLAIYRALYLYFIQLLPFLQLHIVFTECYREL